MDKKSKTYFEENVLRINKKDVLKSKNSIATKIFNCLNIIITAILIAIAIYGYMKGYFTSIDELQNLMESTGKWGVTVFILLQILQVIISIIPGGLGCLAGVILFSPLQGFIYNYISIVIGSCIAFGISKIYGCRFIKIIFSEKMTKKYFGWVDTGNKFKKLFATAIFFPFFPDDLLCYVAGTTKMKWNEFLLIIIFVKPISIAIYSLVLITVSS